MLQIFYNFFRLLTIFVLIFCITCEIFQAKQFHVVFDVYRAAGNVQHKFGGKSKRCCFICRFYYALVLFHMQSNRHQINSHFNAK